jgi:hypothetical protein
MAMDREGTVVRGAVHALAGAVLVAILLVLGAGNEVPLFRLEKMMSMFGLTGASRWIFLGGLVSLLGAFVSLYGAVRNNQEQEQLIRGAPDAFVQLTVYHGQPAVGWYVSTYHRGSSNIYDVQVLSVETTEDGQPLSGLRGVPLGTVMRDTWPVFLLPIGPLASWANGGRPATSAHR